MFLGQREKQPSTLKNTETISALEPSIDYVGCIMSAFNEPSLLRRQELAACGIWIAARVDTRACTGLVAPLTHHTVRYHKAALCQRRVKTLD